ncbi:spore germination lipoprotein GerD [Paenibacillus assamensis]|uniref:spore germination lipoprotein GerD n=1 Tax=Paenibacillus assamensis TaxID=311244 RepID=UPI0003FCF553|nr:spore germination lipoprotein GerD [Paenibacillus assamensis]
MRSVSIRLCITCIVLMLVTTSCSQEPQSSGNKVEYKELKSMVVDILKTEEGQKAIESAQSNGGSSMQMKTMNTQQQEQIRIAVKDTLVSPDYEKVIEKIMKDPKFAGEFAKTISKEDKQIHKDLIKDPTYQKAVGDILKSPDLMNAYLEVTKSPEYRKQLMALMKDAMNSPLFKLEIMEMMTKAVKEELQPKENKKEKGGEEGVSEKEESGSSEGDGSDSGGGGGQKGGQ